MKKFSILCLVLGIFFTSCKTSKLAKQNETNFRGNWVLTSVQPREKTIAISEVFNQASPQCFNGSSWHLVANNHSGNYVFNNANCPTGQTEISWHMADDNGVGYFWFKQIGEGQKAKNVLSGYKLKVEAITNSQAHFSQEVPFDGGKTIIDYYFTKN